MAVDYEVIISEVPILIYAEGGITGDQIVSLLELQPTTPTDDRLDASAIKNLPVQEPMEVGDIRDALETLTGSDRLPASAIYGIPEAQTAEEIKDLLETLTGTDRLSINYIQGVIKTAVQGAAKALNHRATGNVMSTGFQDNMTSALAGDFWIVDGVSSNIYGLSDGDWIIALTADPSFSYDNPAHWLIMNFSKLADVTPPPLSVNSGESTAVENGGNDCEATGTASTALGINTLATADASTSLGRDSISSRPGGVATASGKVVNSGDCQVQRSSMNVTITGETTVVMTDPEDYTFETGKTYALDVRVVARQSGVEGATMKSKSWRFDVLASMSGEGYCDIEQSGGEVLSISDSEALCEILTTSPYIGKLAIACTGVTGATTIFHAYIEAVEVGLTPSEE